MASIHKDPRGKSPYFYCAYKLPSGKRTFRSLKTTDRKEAERLCQSLEHRVPLEASAGRLTEARALELWSEIKKQATGEGLHFRTARQYLSEWLKDTKTNVAIRSYWRYEQAINDFLDHLGANAERLLREISPTDVRSWRDKLRAKGLSAPTVNGNIKVLRMPFKAAHDTGYIDINPTTKTQVRLIKDEARNVERDVFTPEQIGALIKSAPVEDWRGLILLGYTTGLRLRDCSELRWENIDLKRGTITLVTRKTGQQVTAFIHPQFEKWLKKQTRGIGKAPVFPTLAGKSGAGKNGLSMRFKRIMEQAGIKGRLLREANGAGRSQSSLSFHSLRHSFNSALANAAVPQEVRQKLTGHSTIEANKIYTHLELRTLRQAIEQLPTVAQ
jgi:site-specific recombinase XerD